LVWDEITVSKFSTIVNHIRNNDMEIDFNIHNLENSLDKEILPMTFSVCMERRVKEA